MNNHITYYKMKSPYAGDVTKNCALTGPEVDNNFFTLEGRDVKALSVEDNDIVITFLNGEKLKAEDALDNFITNLSNLGRENTDRDTLRWLAEIGALPYDARGRFKGGA